MKMNEELLDGELLALVNKVEKNFIDHSLLTIQDVNLSKSQKWLHQMLMSPEIGYKYVEIEKIIHNSQGGELCSVDFYLPENDLVIEVNGPVHYIFGTSDLKPKISDKITSKTYKNILNVDYRWSDRFINPELDLLVDSNYPFLDAKAEIKQMIEQAIA